MPTDAQVRGSCITRLVSTPRQDSRQNPEFGWSHLHARYRFAYDAALSSSKRFRKSAQSVAKRTLCAAEIWGAASSPYDSDTKCMSNPPK